MTANNVQKIVHGHPDNFLAYRLSSGNTMEILDINVHPEYRRQGIGKAMIEMLRQRLPRECLLIYALTRVSNTSAQEFYEACGFRIVGRLHNFYRTREEMKDGASGYTHALMYGLDI